MGGSGLAAATAFSPVTTAVSTGLAARTNTFLPLATAGGLGLRPAAGDRGRDHARSREQVHGVVVGQRDRGNLLIPTASA